MKQSVEFKDYTIPPSVTEFIMGWKKRKDYGDSPDLTIGQCLELLIGTTYNFHKEESDGRFFNNILINHESTIGWEGEEFVDILFYELTETIKRRLSQQGTHNEEI